MDDFFSGNCISGPCRTCFGSEIGWGKLGRTSVLIPWCWRGKFIQFEDHAPFIGEFNSLTADNKTAY
jgi:hypothetical protein